MSHEVLIKRLKYLKKTQLLIEYWRGRIIPHTIAQRLYKYGQDWYSHTEERIDENTSFLTLYQSVTSTYIFSRLTYEEKLNSPPITDDDTKYIFLVKGPKSGKPYFRN